MADKNSSTSSCFVYYGGMKIQVDNFQCFLAGFSVLLNQINFGYICLALLLLIILISIFGGIKENYRWLILNQAVWDVLLSYRFICFNWAAFNYVGVVSSTCVFDLPTGIFKAMFDNSIDSNSYTSLLLLSFTRFLALYYPTFYRNLTEKRKILSLILIFNFIIIITTFNSIFNNLYRQQTMILKQECLSKTSNISSCPSKYDDNFLVGLLGTMANILYCINFIKPPLCLLISVISAFFIILKIYKQIKFQKSHNPKDLKSNIRICAVISLQTLINIFVFVIETLRNIPLFLGTTFGIANIFQIYVLPIWLDRKFGLTDVSVIQAITQFRILVESMIILLVMTGYRESIVTIFINLKMKLFTWMPKVKNDAKISPIHRKNKILTAVTS